jgi:tetratricopeptide (TPR) repeat protein
MLKKANNLKKDNPYILDSLGWALNLKGNYIDAKFYIEEALTYLPSDPVISDHYGDILWKLGKKIQARYFWKYALVHEDTNEEKIKIIKNKILKGI